ncbi:hypothetical protein GZL_07993 [Streptomyces sp. 769]|nr:hypothetical protein GZL_07993 [Streptomyces sp. 769]
MYGFCPVRIHHHPSAGWHVRRLNGPLPRHESTSARTAGILRRPSIADGASENGSPHIEVISGTLIVRLLSVAARNRQYRCQDSTGKGLTDLLNPYLYRGRSPRPQHLTNA